MATKSNLITRRTILQALTVLSFAGLIPALSVPQEPTPNLYEACINVTGLGIDLVVAAAKLRDGKGTAEEARAELAKLKAAVDAIVI